jgi:hypothetical protein
MAKNTKGKFALPFPCSNATRILNGFLSLPMIVVLAVQFHVARKTGVGELDATTTTGQTLFVPTGLGHSHHIFVQYFHAATLANVIVFLLALDRSDQICKKKEQMAKSWEMKGFFFSKNQFPGVSTKKKTVQNFFDEKAHIKNFVPHKKRKTIVKQKPKRENETLRITAPFAPQKALTTFFLPPLFFFVCLPSSMGKQKFVL